MIEKEFVPYEEALALKELGFDEPCFAVYFNTTQQLYFDKYINEFTKDVRTLAPIFSQAFRWFREKHGICGYVSPLEDGSAFYHMIYTNINVPYSNRICTLPEKWETHEEAELACLKQLIEIQGGNK